MPPDASLSDRPPLSLVVRHYGPWLIALGVAAVAVFNHLHARDRVQRLEARLAAVEKSDASATRSARSRPAQPGPPSSSPNPTPPDDWSCAGAIEQSSVQQAVGRQGAQVLRCIAARREIVPGLAGTLMIRLRVGRDGRVEKANVAGTDDAELIRCVGDRAVTWTFSPPAGGSCAVVETPFSLGPP